MDGWTEVIALPPSLMRSVTYSAVMQPNNNISHVTVQARTPNSITIEVMGRTEVYELLCILDFNNDRKRMSVILRKDDRITLYCKGADSTIYPRLNPKCAELQQITTRHLSEFAQNGLRTLSLIHI